MIIRWGTRVVMVLSLLGMGLLAALFLTGPVADAATGPSITSITISGTVSSGTYVQSPAITLNGSGFNPAPTATSTAYPGFSGLDYGTDLHFTDLTNNPNSWDAGYDDPSHGRHDYIGLAALNYTDTQISYTFGTVYPAYGGIYELHTGDRFYAYVRNVWCSGTVVLNTPIPCGNLSLNPTVTPNPVALNGTATASAGATDSLSGIASQGCDPVNTSSAGTFTANCWATNDAGNYLTGTASYTVNAPPTANAGGPYAGTEGSAITISGAAADTDGDTVTTTWSATASTGTDGTCTIANPAALTTSVTCTDEGSYTLTLAADDGINTPVTNTTQLTVGNAAIMVNPITGLPATPVGVGAAAATVSAQATFTDPGTADAHTATWNWGDSTTSAGVVSETVGSGTGSVTGSHSYSAAGVYTVTVTVDDGDNNPTSTQYQYVVVYDASAGFVTGGGWITSPAGACQLTADCGSATGKASFGFVAKYQKGATVPSGNTEFQFQAGNLDFHSASYQWLVVNQNHNNAQFKGTGTINGAGSYTFMIWATQAANGNPPTFRIQITDNNNNGATVYDNGVNQAIGGGSIVIHN